MSLRKGVPAVLMLEDGTVFRGDCCGAEGEAFGELVFNTSMSGYQEILTDPSYAGQIIAMTYPQIGNYGINPDDMQSNQVFCKGLVVRDMCAKPSNFRSTESLPEFLIEHGIVAIEGVDTRQLVRHLRDNGSMKAVISTSVDDMEALARHLEDAPSIVGTNLVSEVSTIEPYERPAEGERRFKVVAIDCGVKKRIIDDLRAHGFEVEVLPYTITIDEIDAIGPDGVFLSNGPGDPEVVPEAIELAKSLLGRYPLFGICLGHQMLSIAAGADIEKLTYGHHGGNQPVMNLRTGAVEITAQNHGFGQVFQSIGPLIPELSDGVIEHPDDLRFWSERRVAPVVQSKEFGRIQLTHVNLNDGTPEGMVFLDVPAFSVQHHPEAAPGPNDSTYLFEAFARLMDGRDDYLDIEVKEARAAI